MKAYYLSFFLPLLTCQASIVSAQTAVGKWYNIDPNDQKKPS